MLAWVCACMRACTSSLQSRPTWVCIGLNMDSSASSPAHLDLVLCLYHLNHGFHCHHLLCLITPSNVTTHCHCNPVESNTLLLVPPTQTCRCRELPLQPGGRGGGAGCEAIPNQGNLSAVAAKSELWQRRASASQEREEKAVALERR